MTGSSTGYLAGLLGSDSRDVTEDPPVVPDLTGPRKGLFTLSISINAAIKEFRYMGFVRISLITKFLEFLDKPNELLQK